MKTLENLTLDDWGPTMRGIAIPAAVLIVMAQWVAFTWRRPLAGALALVPVRKPDPVDAINKSMAALARYRQAEIEADKYISEILAEVAAEFSLTADELTRIDFTPSTPNLTSTAPNLTTSDLNRAGASISETELGPMSRRMDFGMARPTLPVAPQPPVLAPGPRRRRRGSKQPQGPA